MNTKLLLSWLGLPAGSWPPDDRTLLGLPVGQVDPFAAEKRALELMDRLRPHQLVHPDLVTEGMNRLAQALVAVTTANRPAPPPPQAAPAPSLKVARSVIAPRSMPILQAPSKPQAPVFDPVDLSLPLPPISFERSDVKQPSVPTEIVEAEVVEAEVVEPETRSLPVPPRKPKRRDYAAEPPEPLPDLADFAPPPPAGLVVTATGRREAYRELAGLRRLRRAWRRMRSSAADPAEALLGPAEVCGYLEAVMEVREALDRPGLEDSVLGPAGAGVRVVVRHPLSLAVFRSLVPAQRQALARDWAIGLAAIETRYGAVRGFLLKDAFGRRKSRRRVQAVRRWLGRNPEWVMLVLTVVGLGVALIRSTHIGS